MRFAKIGLIPLATPTEAWQRFQAAVSREIFWERENERASPYKWLPAHYSHESTRRELAQAGRERHAWWEAMNTALAAADKGALRLATH